MKLIPLTLLTSLLLLPPLQAQQPNPLDADMTIAGLKIDMPAKDIIQKIGKPATKAKPIDHDEVTCSVWSYPKQGLSLAMIYDKRDYNTTLSALVIESPSSLKLRSGIKIGTKLETIQKAYAPYYNAAESQESGFYIAGQLTHGILFLMKDNKVKKIGIGYEPFSLCR